MAAASARARDARLYLATAPSMDEGLAAELGTLLPLADIAAVLVRLAPASDRTLLNCLKAAGSVVQSMGAAFLVENRADLVARSGADGAHITEFAALSDTLTQLKPDRIVGAGRLYSRHDAMVAGEAGVDYVLFGEPDDDGMTPSEDAVVERVSWWAEVFVPPCVAYAPSLAAIGRLVDAGADFILVDNAIWQDPRGAQVALREASDIIEARNEDVMARAGAERR